MQERMEAVAVRTMTALRRRELVAEVAGVEMRMQVSQRMVLAAPVALAMETAAAVAVVVVILFRVEPEA